ncbi:hypothetical protein OG562_30850 [Streptomyces sp. NBC_01275]|uniref:hypothetical protein n=1 Tax=Streptomyces sp. NBC_01275 TaxID=2903807 RepID=UPI00224E14C1|nr:hypothetical protein [Streptomyces sp. NBC_01275]MCX4765298.1 hypothetical protein [Streptomyces sp. NBC_01275]
MDGALRDQIKSLHLFEQCNRVLATDEVWSRRLAEKPALSDWDRLYLAGLARDMADGIAAIHDHSDLVLRLLDTYKQASEKERYALEKVSKYASVIMDDTEGVAHLVNQALDHLATHGPAEIVELQNKAHELTSIEGGVPVGDLKRKTWGHIAVIAGFAMLAGSVAMAVCGGPVGVAAGGAVLVLAGALLQKGIDIVMEEP